MFDIWAFLLQTLTASGVAVLLLVVKGMFRDKLPPRWQFAIWSVLGISLLIPAGIAGRYVLFNWPFVVDLIKGLTGDYSFTRVLFPFPVLDAVPQSVWEWLFAIYVLGVAAHLIKYIASYIHLRRILNHGNAVSSAVMDQIQRIADQYNLPVCKTVIVPGLPSAFVCGVCKPVLVVPEEQVDDKVILHELLHLKSHDTVWSIVISIFRSIHWCNPLLVYCANEAGNDLEARCDQMVLELLEGEERRDYGRILLSMSNDRYAKTPGATCVNNGGKNIRYRIEAIARFKLYPVGMKLVSLCAGIILLVPMVIGVQAKEVLEDDMNMELALAYARTTPCTTPAGAFDAYGKAIIDQNGIFRAMCAPETMQEELTKSILERWEGPNRQYPYWETGLPSWPDTQEGYYIYNLQMVGDGYEGLLVVKLNYPPDGQPAQDGMMYLAVQNLRVEKQKGRWVTIPLDNFQAVEVQEQGISWGCVGLPAYVYSATYEELQIDVKLQTVYEVDNQVITNTSMFFGNSTSFDLTPKPNAEFTSEAWFQSKTLIHLGSQEERDEIKKIGLSIARVMEDEERPELHAPGYDASSSGTSNQGTSWSNCSMEPGWGPVYDMHGGGSKYEGDIEDTALPAYYAADLYINNKYVAALTLTLQEGGPQ